MSDSKYENEFSETGFWEKIKSAVLIAGGEVIFLALKLYYALQNPKTPPWAKGVIIAALGYFICPIDAIPDITPVVGYADDLGVLSLAVATVAMYIDADVVAKAAEKMKMWFGDVDKKAS